jgi:hypothetical protein
MEGQAGATASPSAPSVGAIEPLRVAALSWTDFLLLFLLALVLLYVVPKRILRLLRRRAPRSGRA